MPRLIPPLLALLVTALVAGCQLALPGGGRASDNGVTPNAVTGDAIEVTALDAPPGLQTEAAAPDTALSTGAEGTAQPQGAAPPGQPAPKDTAQPAPQPDLAATDTAAPDAAPDTAAELPPVLKSEAQLACEKRDGTWVSTGNSNLQTCVYRTRDGGKQCTRESQCDGQCLARSGTCSPLKPLLGCNEVLQENGVRVTLCLD